LKSPFIEAISKTLMALGLLLVGYVVYVRVYGEAFQAYQERAFRQSLEQLASGESVPVDQPRAHSVVGRLEIPSVNLSVMVLEGVGESELRKGAGHVPGTALPGADGNVGIAGHRDTFFRPLRKLKVGDVIRLTTLRGAWDYEVEKTWVTEPTDVGVLQDGSGSVLTLVTCYPFSYVGPAPDRFIIRARKLDALVSQQ
jgi:sortase A